MSQWLSYLPNLITIGRIVALIPLVWFMLEKQYLYALIVMVAAGISDGLDGYLAKRFGWQGWIGGVLDPLADKFMMLCCYLVLAVQNVIPHWLLIVVLSRDIIIITGATVYHFLIGKIEEAQADHDQQNQYGAADSADIGVIGGFVSVVGSPRLGGNHDHCIGGGVYCGQWCRLHGSMGRPSRCHGKK